MTGRQIADDLDARIRSGEYRVGEQLLFADLTTLYQTSRATIQRAMSLLEDRGLVEYQPGRGRYVREDHPV
jgi:DNA-binding GntR family transcriptional regulator